MPLSLSDIKTPVFMNTRVSVCRGIAAFFRRNYFCQRQQSEAGAPAVA